MQTRNSSDTSTTVIAAVATVVALGVAAIASIATPFGLARVIEPQPGIWIPGHIVAVGAAAVVLGVLACSLFPSWRAALLARREPPALGGPHALRTQDDRSATAEKPRCISLS